MSTTNRAAAGILVGKNGAVGSRLPGVGPADEMAVSAEKKTLIAEPTVATCSKISKGPRRRSQLSQTAAKVKKLVCRYCGSDDLAPSFKKRGDARCRACFKKRYGSTPRGKQSRRPGKAKGAK